MQNLHTHDRAELARFDYYRPAEKRSLLRTGRAGGESPGLRQYRPPDNESQDRAQAGRSSAHAVETPGSRRAFSWLGLRSEDLERLRCSAEAPTSITRWQRSALCGSRRINTWTTSPDGRRRRRWQRSW